MVAHVPAGHLLWDVRAASDHLSNQHVELEVEVQDCHMGSVLRHDLRLDLHEKCRDYSSGYNTES